MPRVTMIAACVLIGVAGAAALAITVAAILLPWASVNQRQFGFFGVA